MLKVPRACGGEEDAQESQQWWEPRHVVYGMSIPVVKATMERLVGTYIVRATDKKFMIRLGKSKREDHAAGMRRMIAKREMDEVEREKRLILEGKMPIDLAPTELSTHPVFWITQYCREIQERQKRLEKEKKKKEGLKGFDYSILHYFDHDDKDSDISTCMSVKDSTSEYDEEKVIDYDHYKADPDDFHRIKYEDDDVAEFKEMDSVDEMYPMADIIVGPLTGKRCGGMVVK